MTPTTKNAQETPDIYAHWWGYDSPDAPLTPEQKEWNDRQHRISRFQTIAWIAADISKAAAEFDMEYMKEKIAYLQRTMAYYAEHDPLENVD